MSSEGLAYGEHPTTPGRRLAYGDGQFSYEPPAELEERLDRRTELMLALAVFTPVVATYAAIAYGLYLAARSIL